MSEQFQASDSSIKRSSVRNGKRSGGKSEEVYEDLACGKVVRLIILIWRYSHRDVKVGVCEFGN